MSDYDRRIPGTVGWIDLTTTDIDAARVFYGNLFGWRMEQADSPFDGAWVGFAGGKSAAGMMRCPTEFGEAGLTAAWLTCMRVESLENTISIADDHGAKVALQPVELRAHSRAAILRDPLGAAFGILQGPNRVGLHLRTDAGAPCWAEILTRDAVVSGEFYEAVFGWTSATDTTITPPYTTFTRRRFRVAGMMAMPDRMPADLASQWLAYFHVADCAQAVGTTVRLGGTITIPPTTVPHGTYALLADPMGTTFAVFEAPSPR